MTQTLEKYDSLEPVPRPEDQIYDSDNLFVDSYIYLLTFPQKSQFGEIIFHK